jgi:hypothetical protein
VTGLGFVRLGLAEIYTKRYAEMVQEAQVEITRGVVGGTTQVYAGQGRVHVMSGAMQMGFGDEPQYMTTGTISIPVHSTDGGDVDPQVNDMVLVVWHRESGMIGRSYRVMHVDAGGQFNDVVSMRVVGSEDSPTGLADSAPDPGPGPWDV